MTLGGGAARRGIVTFACLALAAVVVASNGCGTSQAPPVSANGDGTRYGAGGPCSPVGATRACHVPLVPVYEGVLLCFDGQQTCGEAGTWGDCGGPGSTRGPGTPPSDAGVDAAPPPFGPVPINPESTVPEAILAEASHALAPIARAQALLTRATELLPTAHPDAPARAATLPTLAPGDVRWLARADGTVRPVRAQATAARATVLLPPTADGYAEIEEATSHVRARFRLEGAAPSPIAPAAGTAVYLRALGDAPLYHRVVDDGTEDLVLFAQRPRVERLSYDVDVSAAAGLRLVADTFELLDAHGAPRLRVAPPYVIGPDGARAPAHLSVEGCAFDTNPAAPWNRPVTAPGSARCRVSVAWSAPAYPLLVDPTWTATGAMSTARELHSESLLGTGQVLVAGGRNGNTYYKTAELFDPTTGTWAATSSMASTRAMHFAASFGSGAGMILIAGGLSGNSVLSAAELYDASSGLFSALPSMNTARYAARGTVLTTTANVLITGGYNAFFNPTSTAEIFDVNNLAFSYTGSMGAARASHHALEVSSGTVLVTGGWNGAAELNSAELYSEASGTFTATTTTMTVARSRHAAAMLNNGLALVTGGWNQSTNTSLTSAELFDPSTGKFTATGSMATARGYHVARRLASGQVLVAGGMSNGAATASSEVYDPTAGTFSSAGNMLSARAFHGGASLQAGTVLVTGGENAATTVLASAEILASPPGAACASNSDCTTDICANGICCTGACTGTCMGCQATTGACVQITNAPDPDSCPAPNVCSATGTCGPPPDSGVVGDAAPSSDSGFVSCLNPCDPTCEAFASAEAGIVDPSAGGYFGSSNGLGATPAGFTSKELCNPCTGPFPQTCGSFTHYNSFDACESDYHCNTSTGQCVQNAPGWTWPSNVCAGVDLTVQGSCQLGNSQVFFVCNRGNTAVASGTSIPFYIVNGNQWSVNPNTCPTLSTSCSTTLKTPLNPGTCQTVSSCSWAGNAVVYVNNKNTIAECASPTGPGCGDNWADIKAGAVCQQTTAYSQTTFNQQYVAYCPPGTHVHWGLLNYFTEVATDSSGASDVTFQAQTAPMTTSGPGTFGSWHTLADAVKTDPAVCEPPCAADVYKLLGGAPDATNEVMNLKITVGPTPDGLLPGKLDSYVITFSCPDTE